MERIDKIIEERRGDFTRKLLQELCEYHTALDLLNDSSAISQSL